MPRVVAQLLSRPHRPAAIVSQPPVTNEEAARDAEVSPGSFPAVVIALRGNDKFHRPAFDVVAPPGRRWPAAAGFTAVRSAAAGSHVIVPIGTVVDELAHLHIFPSVQPWDCAQGLSFVELSALRSPSSKQPRPCPAGGNANELRDSPPPPSPPSSCPTRGGGKATSALGHRHVERGMLFWSSSERPCFWSGGIRTPLDTAFVRVPEYMLANVSPLTSTQLIATHAPQGGTSRPLPQQQQQQQGIPWWQAAQLHQASLTADTRETTTTTITGAEPTVTATIRYRVATTDRCHDEDHALLQAAPLLPRDEMDTFRRMGNVVVGLRGNRERELVATVPRGGVIDQVAGLVPFELLDGHAEGASHHATKTKEDDESESSCLPSAMAYCDGVHQAHTAESDRGDVRFVLETRRGWFSDHGVLPTNTTSPTRGGDDDDNAHSMAVSAAAVAEGRAAPISTATTTMLLLSPALRAEIFRLLDVQKTFVAPFVEEMTAALSALVVAHQRRSHQRLAEATTMVVAPLHRAVSSLIRRQVSKGGGSVPRTTAGQEGVTEDECHEGDKASEDRPRNITTTTLFTDEIVLWIVTCYRMAIGGHVAYGLLATGVADEARRHLTLQRSAQHAQAMPAVSTTRRHRHTGEKGEITAESINDDCDCSCVEFSRFGLRTLQAFASDPSIEIPDELHQALR